MLKIVAGKFDIIRTQLMGLRSRLDGRMILKIIVNILMGGGDCIHVAHSRILGQLL
jgi:hypothetical protein